MMEKRIGLLLLVCFAIMFLFLMNDFNGEEEKISSVSGGSAVQGIDKINVEAVQGFDKVSNQAVQGFDRSDDF